MGKRECVSLLPFVVVVLVFVNAHCCLLLLLCRCIVVVKVECVVRGVEERR